MNKHYIIYKITNITNGMFYIGLHETYDLNDDYMGSGVEIVKAIAVEGKQNFTREILESFDTREAMYSKEAEIVNPEFLKNPNVYNVAPGGGGGWAYVNNNPEVKEKAPKGWKQRYASDPETQKRIVENLKAARAIYDQKYPNGWWNGKKHKEESKQKQSQSMQGKQDGVKNSQHGTKWITDGIVNKKIKLQDDIPSGWRKGRINTPEFMEKITRINQSEQRKLYGEKNPSYGKSPITNGIINKRLKQGDPMPEGWWIGQPYKKKESQYAK